MSRELPTTEFRGKTRFYVVAAIVFGGLAAFSLVLGPLFLFEIAKGWGDRGDGGVVGGRVLVSQKPVYRCYSLN